jgi:hypothetical protein
MENTVNDLTVEFLKGKPENEVMQRVQQWFAEGRRLAWMKILSQENFPDTPIEILQWADRSRYQSAWFIHRAEEFMKIPSGIAGWLLPDGNVDTDLVAGLWEGTVHFLKAIDRCTGEPQTLMTGRVWDDLDEDGLGDTPLSAGGATSGTSSSAPDPTK